MREAEDIKVFRTADHVCGYWPDRVARDLVIDPDDPRLPRLYPHAISWGFRRSGNIVYRPDCATCRQCVAVRIPVDAFVPDRSQRRCLTRNADLDMRIVPAERTDEQFALYRKYLEARHANGGMDDHTPTDFDQFLSGRWSDSRFMEIRTHRAHGQGALLAVAVTDLLPAALSAVYTFFDPEHTRRGLGTFGVLQQIAWAQREHRGHVYLGYWIDAHPKMTYKRRFHPLEGYDGQHWRPLE